MEHPPLPESGNPSEAANAVSPRPGLGEMLTAGEEGSVAFEYALVAAAIGIPMVSAVFYLLGIVSDMYRAQMLILNAPF